MDIGQAIRVERVRRRMTQVQLANAAGISNAWLSNVERHNVMPSGPYLRILALTLGVTVEYLLNEARRY